MSKLIVVYDPAASVLTRAQECQTLNRARTNASTSEKLGPYRQNRTLLCDAEATVLVTTNHDRVSVSGFERNPPSSFIATPT